MRYSEQSLPVGVVSGPVAAIDTDVLVVAAFEGDSAALGAAFDGAAAGRVAAALESREFTGKAGTIFVTPCASPGWRPARLMLVGAGSRSGFDTAELRRAATAAALASRDKRWRRVAFVLPGGAAARRRSAGRRRGPDAGGALQRHLQERRGRQAGHH